MSGAPLERPTVDALAGGATRRRIRSIEARGRAALPQGGRRLVATTFWSFVAEAFSRGVLMLTMILVARRLGAEAYGEFGIIRSTITVFATLGGMGLGLTANRFVAEYRDSDKTYSGHLIGSTYLLASISGAIVGVGVLVAAGPLARSVLHAPQLTTSLRIAAVLLLLGAVNGAQTGILQGLDAYRRLAFGSFAQGIAALVFMVGGTYRYGLQGAVFGLLAYTCVGTVVVHRLIADERRRQAIPPSFGGLAATLPILWRFSLPVMLAGIAIAPLKWSAETMLARRLGFAELGIFHAAMTIANMLITIVSTLNAPLISLAANAGNARDDRLPRASLYGSWYLAVVLSLPLVLFPQAPALLFGARYAGPELARAIVLLAAYCALMGYYNGILRMLALRGSMWFGLFTNLMEGAALLVGFHLFATQGASGLAMAYVGSYVVRIAVSLPHLARGTVVPRRLLADRWFLGTLVAYGGLVVAQLRVLR